MPDKSMAKDKLRLRTNGEIHLRFGYGTWLYVGMVENGSIRLVLPFYVRE